MLQISVQVPTSTTSRKPSESKWAVHEREALAIIHSVLTDCYSLTFLLKAQHGRLFRWLLLLQQYNLSIHHIEGNLNCISDTLSRSIDISPQDNQDLEDSSPSYT
eukprot:GHVP01043556.1.p2 GENE.GHVP01043556.1~~GHVP01043556.1.p2  ORF type:complete len:105 (+),score=11.52 GHVP01043556.1:393-707(+)